MIVHVCPTAPNLPPLGKWVLGLMTPTFGSKSKPCDRDWIPVRRYLVEGIECENNLGCGYQFEGPGPFWFFGHELRAWCELPDVPEVLKDARGPDPNNPRC